VKRFLVRGPDGRPLSEQSERLTDDGRGSLHVTNERSAEWCSGCHRPVTDLAEWRGLCDLCRCRQCCVHCLSHCDVCSRRLCGHCRRGFAGPPVLTVCVVCQDRLLHRQVLQDQQAEFENEVTRHRLFHQDQALRLNHERLQLTAHLQAARLGLNRTSPFMRIVKVGRWTGITLYKVVRYALHPLR
jgi:hypothetical protein